MTLPDDSAPALAALRDLPLPRPSTDRALQRWLDPTELERRLEAHLLIARRISA